MAVSLFEAIFQADELTSLEALVLITIADRVNERALQTFIAGEAPLPGASPGLRSTARRAKMTTQGVSNVLTRLESAGLIRVQAGSTNRPQTYFIPIQVQSDGAVRLVREALDALARVRPDRTRRVPPGRTRDTGGVLSHGTPEAQSAGGPCPMGTDLVSHGNESGVPPGRTKPEEPEEPEIQTAAPRRDAFGEERGEEPEDGPPFKVYVAIATAMLERALKDYRTDDESTVGDLFKTACAQQQIPYNSDLTGRAVRAALHAREKAKERFLERLNTTRLTPHARGSRVLGAGGRR